MLPKSVSFWWNRLLRLYWSIQDSLVGYIVGPNGWRARRNRSSMAELKVSDADRKLSVLSFILCLKWLLNVS